MNKNMGSLDRGIRTLVAVVVAILIAMGVLSGTWAWVLGIVAVVFLLTSLVSFCPIYALFGLSTCRVKQNQ
ncbi:MAG: membrane protein [Candidatus Kapaibacterium sp.]|nr:MAG: membrane protein [Candidatus Kapabacteria bacterium]